MLKNLHELVKSMPDEATCRKYLAGQRWQDGIAGCLIMAIGERMILKAQRYKCKSKECYKKFSVTVGMVFEASNALLTKWFMALFIVSGHKKGISSHQLGRDTGVTQRIAWFLLHRIREAIGLKDVEKEKISGTVEIDETYMSRKYRSDYKGLRDVANALFILCGILQVG
jgi:hypothetical protein